MNWTELLQYWKIAIFGALCLVAFIQIFYYVFFFTRLALYKAKPKASSQTHPVSVIICARDEADNLAKNLPGALLQQYKTTHEVIVVNDNSYDDTKYLLEEFKKEFKHLNPIELKQEAKLIPGKKFPLSVGIKSAKYEIMLLTDADCVPASENWIEKIQETYDEQTEIVLGYGAYHKKKGFLNKLIRWETFHSALQYFSYALVGIPYMGVGRNLSYKRGVFYRHKGFSSHNNIPGGDDDLFINMAANRKNTKINVDKEAFTLSEPPKTFNQWVRQKNRHYSTSKHYKFIHKFLLGLYSLSHFLFYPLVVATAIFYCWQLALIILGVRMVTQGIILYSTMKRLNEQDLFPLFLFFDIWMFFYYILFSFSLVKKPRNTWK